MPNYYTSQPANKSRMLKSGAVTPDQAEMARNLETTLFGSSGPGPRALSQTDDECLVSGPAPCSGNGAFPSNDTKQCSVQDGCAGWGGVGNREQVILSGILLSGPGWTDLCPDSTGGSHSEPRPQARYVPPTLVSENSGLFKGFIHSHVVGVLFVCLRESYISRKQKS